MAEDKVMEKKNRVAVVVIHGIGEQIPMGTMSDIVKSFLAYEETMGYISPSQNYFSAPTNFADSYEVQKWIVKENDCYRHLNPPQEALGFDDNLRDPHVPIESHDGKKCEDYKRPMTDFYELYWAPMMNDNKFSHVFPWMTKLLLNKGKDSRVNGLIALLFAVIFGVLVIPSFIMWRVPDFLIPVDVVNGLAVFKKYILLLMSLLTFSFFVFLFLWLLGLLFSKIKSIYKTGLAFVISAPFGYWAFIYMSSFDIEAYNQNRLIFSLFVGLIVTAFLFKTTGDLLKKFLADAARYYDPLPTNVENRERIRKLGVKLLENLSDADKYDRVVVLSHSLGSAVGYDILRLYWAKHCKYYTIKGADSKGALQFELGAEELEKYAGKDNEMKVKERSVINVKYQKLQSEYFKSLQDSKAKDIGTRKPWLVSDFISVGSPLSKLRLFSAEGDKKLEWERRNERTILTNPPMKDYATKEYYYKVGGDSYKFHHGALFAFTRWTNIFHSGDWIGGDIDSINGKGTKNIKLDYSKKVDEGWISYCFNKMKSLTPLMHTEYWSTNLERHEKHDTPEMEDKLKIYKFEKSISFEAIEEIYKAMHF